MNTLRARLARRLGLVVSIFLALAVAAGAAPSSPRAAAAARALETAGSVTFSVAGQPRTLDFARGELAVPRSDAGGLPAEISPLRPDAQHRFYRLPAGASVVSLVEADAQRAALALSVGAAPAARAALRPVFYERGRTGDPAARHVATLDILLVGVDASEAQALASATGATGVSLLLGNELPVLSYASAWEMLAAASALQAQGIAASPQFTHSISKKAAPNDPLYNQQFYFKNTGQGGGTAGEDLNIESLWPSASGAGVTVAVVDDGLEITHPDLAPNVVTDSSLHRNVLDSTSDPTPPAAANHGTICAGFIAARGDNGIGITGAAPQARLLGVRLLGEGANGSSATDVQEAAAFGWRTDVVTISSNSWGPNDDAKTVSGPESGALAALRSGVTSGRGGRGVVFLVATGNGRDSGDHAGYDGYSGSRYVLAIGATDNRGRQAPFSESGPQVIACAAGQTSEGADAQLLATDNIGERGANKTASPGGDYTTDGVQGTSYSTPQVAGVAALLLQASPNLGWRDVKEILIRSARKNDASDSDWLNNGAGFHFNHKYGAGFVDAAAALALARTWTNLGAETSATQASTTSSAIPDNDPAGASRTLAFAGATDLRVETIEVTVSVTHARRGDLRFEVTSPAGTRTILGAPRSEDTGADFANWVFSSPRHWGESGNGAWTVRVIDTVNGTSGTLTRAAVTLYGTAITPGAPTIAAHPLSTAATVGGSVTLGVTAAGAGPFTYQWRKDGANLPGATSATLTLSNLTVADGGSYSVIVTNASGSLTSNAATLTVNAPAAASRLVNLSILTGISAPGDSFTLGYVVGGEGTSGAKPLVIRAAGPSLGAIGVPGTLADPKLEVFAGASKTGENDNWGGAATVTTAMAAVGAFPYANAASLDAALVANITTRDNSVKVSATNNGTGTVIAEVYDATPSDRFTSATPRLVNVSVLKQFGTGFTIGFVIRGPAAKAVLIRAIGPGLAAVGLTSGFEPDPQLTLFGAGAAQLGLNNDWGGTAALSAAFAAVGAFNLPASSKDAALLATLQPGDYTVQVSGSGGSGLGLVEVYEVP